MNIPNQEPLEWIHLELMPLPDADSCYTPAVLWWNPQTGELLGDQAEFVKTLVDKQLQVGHVEGSFGSIELSAPFTTPTELAVILGQFYWVIPQPVAYAYESVDASFDTEKPDPVRLQ